MPYYAYDGLGQLVNTVKEGTTRQERQDMDLITEREARLLFRITNFFNPHCILQMGLATGIESIAMLAVNSASHLYVYDKNIEQNTLAIKVLSSQLKRVDCYDDATVAVDEFMAVAGEGGIALFNITADEVLLHHLLDAGTVVMLRHLSHDEAMWNLFDSCCNHMVMGQTYTNGKIAILNPSPKLQREDFLLWL